jgi:hypothetical protein
MAKCIYFLKKFLLMFAYTFLKSWDGVLAGGCMYAVNTIYMCEFELFHVK